ncbi:hypothetical protein BGX31_002621 [Mortierella sp. GBA43]|nr:hypothetical protein BGX31_002621 [Mortierella sp. GBA43]
MPSIINTHHTPSAPPSSLEFVSDDAAYYRNTHPSSPSKPSATLQDLKESNRRQWYDPDDEFSVPIHTKHPLITKKPLDMSSFLLNYRTMHRSIEIMTPPPSSQISDEVSIVAIAPNNPRRTYLHTSSIDFGRKRDFRRRVMSTCQLLGAQQTVLFMCKVWRKRFMATAKAQIYGLKVRALMTHIVCLF